MTKRKIFGFLKVLLFLALIDSIIYYTIVTTPILGALLSIVVIMLLLYLITLCVNEIKQLRNQTAEATNLFENKRIEAYNLAADLKEANDEKKRLLIKVMELEANASK